MKPDEPAPQKPDLRLPPDAIRAKRPLEEHIRRQEEKRRGETPKEPVAPLRPAPEPEASPDVSAGLLGGREERRRRRGHRAEARRRQQQGTPLAFAEDEDGDRSRATLHRRARAQRAAAIVAPRRSAVALSGPVTVRALSEASGVPAAKLVFQLVKLGMTNYTVNSTLDLETATLLASEFGVGFEVKPEQDIEQIVVEGAAQQDADEDLALRPPVATLLGHVDHGKTSLLDAIRKSNVVAGEAGGITQHIGAYQVEHNGHCVTFVDTPGHEAFTAMRARGANVTDIAILVVAADDGVMPQTEEAISHARAAGVPIIVAMNKIDMPSANPARVLQQLAGHNLLPAEWGGDTEVVQTSATRGRGIDELLETLITLAELRDLKANPDAPASGVCLEASLSVERGVLATFLVQRGTLQVGDAIWCGDSYGRVKAMYDDQARALETAPPSTPVLVTGLDVAPSAGERFYVVEDRARARELAERRQQKSRTLALGELPHITLESFFQRRQQQQVRDLSVILKADTRGSVEAIRQEFTKLVHPEVRVRLLHHAVGAVNESDVYLADASDAVILAFNVSVEDRAQTLADHEGVQVRRYSIIYEIVDDVRKALEGLIAPEKREVQQGRASVLQVFKISRIGTVAGCRATSGTFDRNCRVRLFRGGVAVGAYPIASLRREKDDVRDVREGFEFGIRLAGFDDVHVGDELEAFKVEEVRRSL